MRVPSFAIIDRNNVLIPANGSEPSCTLATKGSVYDCSDFAKWTSVSDNDAFYFNASLLPRTHGRFEDLSSVVRLAAYFDREFPCIKLIAAKLLPYCTNPRLS